MAIAIDSQPTKVSRDTIVSTIDREARRRLDMSAGEMLTAYRRGELAEPGRVGDLLVLADLLAEDDELVAGG